MLSNSFVPFEQTHKLTVTPWSFIRIILTRMSYLVCVCVCVCVSFWLFAIPLGIILQSAILSNGCHSARCYCPKCHGANLTKIIFLIFSHCWGLARSRSWSLHHHLHRAWRIRHSPNQNFLETQMFQVMAYLHASLILH